jgi:hypothetical protein
MITIINGQIMNTTIGTRVQAYTVKELATLYGISEKTFKGCLQPHAEIIGKKQGCIYL